MSLRRRYGRLGVHVLTIQHSLLAARQGGIIIPHYSCCRRCSYQGRVPFPLGNLVAGFNALLISLKVRIVFGDAAALSIIHGQIHHQLLVSVDLIFNGSCVVLTQTQVVMYTLAFWSCLVLGIRCAVEEYHLASRLVHGVRNELILLFLVDKLELLGTHSHFECRRTLCP